MPSPLRPATDITTVFGRTLGAVRALAGYSQTELAALIPVDRSAIARFEIGRTTTSVPMLVAIERPLLAARALRRPGDLMLLTMRTASRLRAGGASVYLDRPPSGAPKVSIAEVVAAAEATVRAWADRLAAADILPGPPPSPREPEPLADDPGDYEVARWMTEEEEADLFSQEPPPKGFIRATVKRPTDDDLLLSRPHLRSQTRREEDIEPKARREEDAEPRTSRFIRATVKRPTSDDEA